jgi:glucosyl-dolichyl phosphate glucuronosyltransferase
MDQPGRPNGAGEPDRATVVVTTYRRPDSLGHCLRGLAGQTDPGVPWEVVVVDNGPAPGSEQVVETVRPTFPVPCRYVREPQLGTAYARNRGLAEASGGIIAIVDDDVVPADDWLSTLLEPLRTGRCDAVGGRVLLDPTVPRPRWFSEDLLGGYLTRHDPAEAERPLADGEYVLTANCAFRADLLREAGGFDPALGPRGRNPMVNDDVAIVRAVQALGGRLHHAPGALVIHELPRSRLRPWYLLRRTYAQGRSDWRVDEASMRARRAMGMRTALFRIRQGLRRRSLRGVGPVRIVFLAACDFARAAGVAREALTALARARLRRS